MRNTSAILAVYPRNESGVERRVNVSRTPDQSDVRGVFMATDKGTLREGVKRCRICGEWKPRAEFSLRRDSRDRLRGECARCVIAARGRALPREVIPEGVPALRWKNVERTPRGLWDMLVQHRVTPEPNTGCWFWSGAVVKEGRPTLHISGRRYYISRLACAVFYGADLQDRTWFACHHCDTPDCINPDHLYVGNKSTNMRDDYRRGARPMGPKITHCKQGHEQTPESTYTAAPTKCHPHGKRVCRACHLEHARRSRARQGVR